MTSHNRLQSGGKAIGEIVAEKSFPLPAVQEPVRAPASEPRIGTFSARRSRFPGGARRRHWPRESPEMPSESSFPGRPPSSATATRCWEPRRPMILLPEAARRRSSDDPALQPIAGRFSRYPEKRRTSARSSGGRIACEARQKGGQSVNRCPQFGHFRRKTNDRNIFTQPSTTRRNVRFRRSWHLNVVSWSQPGQFWQYEGSSPDSTRCVWALIFSSMDMILQL
jgi:hypothetical protein